LAELGLTPTFWNLNAEHWKLIAFCERLLKMVEDVIVNRQFKYEKTFQKAVAIILAKGYTDAEAVVTLAKSGYGREAATLCRPIVEGAINCLYIAADPDKRSWAFLKSIAPDVRKLAEKLRRTSSSEEILEAFEKADQLTKESGWPRTVTERLRALGPGYEAYDLVFTMLSQVVHSSVSSISGAYEETEREISILVGPSTKDIELSLMIVVDFFKTIALTAFDALGVDRAPIDVLLRQFEATRIRR